jgi:hypothetical protein
MSDLQLCGAKQLRKHEVGFIANKIYYVVKKSPATC